MSIYSDDLLVLVCISVILWIDYKMMTPWILIFFIFMSGCSANFTEKDLLKHLFRDYDPRARPVLNVSQAVVVNATYYLLAVEDLSEKLQVLKTYGWLNLFWQDDYLTWDPAEWGNIDEVVVPGNNVWKPDAVIKNSADQVYGDVLDQDDIFRVQILPDGTVDMWTSGDLQTSCQVDMTYFPFDDQACMIQLDSWSSSTRKMVLMSNIDEVVLDYYRENGQWNIIKTSAIRETIVYTVDEFDYVRFFIYLQRKPMYFVYNIVLPSVLLSLLVLLIFLLPADAGEKISLGITVLLAFSVFQLLIADSMPKTSDFLPLIGIYIICTMVVTALSILTTVIILAIHHHHPHKPVPTCLRKTAIGFSKIMCMRTSLHALAEKIRAETYGVHITQNGMNHDGVQITENGMNHDGGTKPDRMNACRKTDDQDGEHPLDNIAGDLSFLRKSREEDDFTSCRKEEWVEVARILDRLFLVFFLSAILIASIVLFGIYPTQKPDMPSLVGI